MQTMTDILTYLEHIVKQEEAVANAPEQPEGLPIPQSVLFDLFRKGPWPADPWIEAWLDVPMKVLVLPC